MKLDLVKMHGNSNDILISKKPLGTIFKSESDASEFIKAVCDRSGPLGADGIYFLDLNKQPIEASFYNPDSSFAGMCGNGLRCVSRMLLEINDVKKISLSSDNKNFEGMFTDSFPEVVTTQINTNGINFSASSLPIKCDSDEFLEQTIKDSGTDYKFTALSIPNNHIVIINDSYDEEKFMDVGEKLSVSNSVLPHGANVSIAVPISSEDYFVRTYERGAGPTGSCGSGATAVRATLTKLGIITDYRKVLIRNIGGPSYVSLDMSDAGIMYGMLDGNATYVYRTAVDLDHLDQDVDLSSFPDEQSAFEKLYQENKSAIMSSGIECDFSPADVGRGVVTYDS